MSTRRISVVAFNGISAFHLSIPSLIFGIAREGLGIEPYDFKVCSLEKGILKTDGGFSINSCYGLEHVRNADIVVIPSWRDENEEPPVELLESLRAAHERGAVLVGLSLGVFVIAKTGLLDGRRATTHWFFSDKFSSRFPRVKLEHDSLYVDEGDI